MLDRNVAIDCVLLPNRGVECGSLLGWSFSDHGLCPVNIGHIFCGHFHEIAIVQAVQRSDLCIWQCCDLLPLHLEGDLILESKANPMPVQWLQTTPTFNMQTRWENVTWNKENTWGMRTSWGILVIFMWHPPLGGQEQVFRPFQATETLLGNFWPKKNFFSTAWTQFVPGTPWCHCICMWSWVVQTNFFLTVFLYLKNRLCTYSSGGEINPGHYF